MSSINKYYQKERYLQSDIADIERLNEKKVKLFLNILKNQKFERVLDAGCGDGRIVQLIGQRLGIPFYGVDISKRGIELAKEKGVKTKIADLSRRIPFPDAYFDLVISTEVLEHVSDPDTFLKEVYRVLKPGGELLLTTPNLSSWTNRFLFALGIYPIFLEASTETKVGYGIFSNFFYTHQLVGHIHVFNLLALKDILKFHKYSIKKINGGTTDFVAPSSKVVTAVYSFFDKIMTKFPSLSSDLIALVSK